MADKTGYIGRNPGDSSVIIAKQYYTAAGIQTDFSFSAGYTVGYLDVYLNGIRLISPNDYSATDGGTVGLTTYAVAGDTLELVAYKAFNVGNVTNAGGNFNVGQNLTVGGTYNIGIHSAGTEIASEVKNLNFVGAGNTLQYDASTNTVDISIAGGGGGAGAFTTSVTGIQTTSQIVGIGTTSTDDADLQGIGNSARGMYVSNGMIIMDNLVSGNHYIGTNFNGMMVGPVNIEGTISIDGNYVVV